MGNTRPLPDSRVINDCRWQNCQLLVHFYGAAWAGLLRERSLLIYIGAYGALTEGKYLTLSLPESVMETLRRF